MDRLKIVENLGGNPKNDREFKEPAKFKRKFKIGIKKRPRRWVHENWRDIAQWQGRGKEGGGEKERERKLDETKE